MSAEQVVPGNQGICLGFFPLTLDRPNRCPCVSIMMGWALAKSWYKLGLIPLGRKVVLLPDPGCWPLEKKDDSLFLAPEPEGDL